MKNTSWVVRYLGKKGKSIETLEKALGHMTKGEIIEKFQEYGWDLQMKYSKKQLVTTVMNNVRRELGEEEWMPTFVNEGCAFYFGSQAQEFAFYLLEMNGEAQASKLRIYEVEDHNIEMARAWLKAVNRILESGNLSKKVIENAKEVAQCLFDDMVG